MRQSVFKLPKQLLFSATLALLFSGQAMAQETESASADNAYRAEIVILERIVAPEDVTEQMAGRDVMPSPALPAQLQVVDAAGVSHSTLQLVSKNEMRLASAANRLVNSGRYRVLMTAAWYQRFPPNYEGQPMQVAVGDWLPEAGMREVEGTITIDRQRYLHVNVALNHWQSMALETLQNSTPATVTPIQQQPQTVAGMAQGGDLQAGSSAPEMELAAPRLNAELLTWIRETRRMRSEEIHFLDSPTIGVLVFFRKIEN